MDDSDRRIINHLLGDGRATYREIGEHTGLATTTAHKRVAKLRDQGIIKGTGTLIDWDAVGLPITAVISIESAGRRSLADVAARLEQIPYVRNTYAITGEFDLMLTVRARSSDHVGELLDMIRSAAPGRTRTVVVLATYFEGRPPPVDVA